MDTKIEKIIIIVLWVSQLITIASYFTINEPLFLSDVIGLFGTVIITGIYWTNKKVVLFPLAVLLFLGMLNIATFTHILDLGIAFGLLGKSLTPGIQFFSLLLFFVLALFRRPILLEGINALIGNSSAHREEQFSRNILHFRNKFSDLSEDEIDKKLQLGLSEEATIALKMLKEERKSISDLQK